MEFVRDFQLLYKLLFVDGIGRSGKVLMAEILTGYNSIEKQEYNEFIEYISLAYMYEKISLDMAQTILKTQMDGELYNSMIGRNINSRPSDYTSISKFHSPEKYFKRQGFKDGFAVKGRVDIEKPVYLNWCHDLIHKSEIVFSTFENKVSLIYMNRRPIDIIYEWDQKDFGNRISEDPTDLTYSIRYKDAQVPESALGWEAEYLVLNPMERIIRIIHSMFKRNLEAIKKMNKENQILIINFEDLVVDTPNTLNCISNFLSLEPLDFMDSILLKENCPRKLSSKEYNKRKNNISNQLSEQNLPYLDEMDDMYLKISSYSINKNNFKFI